MSTFQNKIKKTKIFNIFVQHPPHFLPVIIINMLTKEFTISSTVSAKLTELEGVKAGRHKTWLALGFKVREQGSFQEQEEVRLN